MIQLHSPVLPRGEFLVGTIPKLLVNKPSSVFARVHVQPISVERRD